MFYDHSGIELEVKNRGKFEKFTNMYILNNIVLNLSKKKSKKEVRKFFKINKNKQTKKIKVT